MNKAFVLWLWENFPSVNTALNDYHLNLINRALSEIDDRVIRLDANKLNAIEASELLSGVSYDDTTGILTFTKKNGSSLTVDLPTEKIALNIFYDPVTEKLILPLVDGTQWEVDLSRLITEYEFSDSDTIAVSVSPDGKVTAIVKEGSIGERHLRPNYLADIKVEAGKAQTSAANAATSEANAKTSESAAKASQTAAKTSETNAANSASTATTKAAAAANSASAAKTSETNAKTSETNAKTSETNAASSKTAAATSATNAANSANKAETKATEAANSATQSKSYAVGGTGTRTGENTDNSKYYYEQSKDIYDNFSSAGNVVGVKGDAEKAYRTGNINLTPADIGALPADGNAASAAKLANAHTVDGVSFNGTSGITHYGSCATAAATAAKAVACTGFVLAAGARVTVKFTVTNTAANPTLNVNGTGAKPIYYRGAAIAAGYLAANRTYEFIYNGTQYELVGDINTDTNTDTKVAQTNVTDSNSYRVLLSNSANDATETNGSKKSTNLQFNPATGALTALGYNRQDISGKTLDINTLTLSAGSPQIQRFINKTNGGATNITNIPVANLPFILDVELIRWASTTDYITKQTFKNSNSEWERTCTSGTWSGWTQKKFTDSNTTYGLATATADGLLSAHDKTWIDGKFKRYVYGVDGNTTNDLGYYKIATLNITGTYSTRAIKLRISSDNFVNYAQVPVDYTLVVRSNSATAGSAINVWGYCDLMGASSAMLNNLYVKYTNVTGTGGICEIYFNKTAAYQKITVDVLGELIRGSTASTANYQSSGWVFSANSVISSAITGTGYAVQTFKEAIYSNTIGSAMQPVYLNKGVPTACSKTLNDFLPLSGGTVTGTLTLSKATDADGTKNNSPALIVGGTATQQHVEIDGNEIMSKSDGTTPAELYINGEGGRVVIGEGGLWVKGKIQCNSLSMWDNVHWQNDVIRVYDDGDGDANNGAELVIGARGNTFIGSGESFINLRDALQAGVAPGEGYSKIGERLFLSSDDVVYIFSNVQTVADRKGIVFDANGCLRPLVDQQMNVGAAQLAWGAMWARAFYSQHNGKYYGRIDIPTLGTASAVGLSRLILGNAAAKGTDGNAKGTIVLFGEGTYYTSINPGENTANATLTLPTLTGTLARTADNVASATKLQTARAINGTAFDGTANITTAKWGAARTIGIAGDVVGSTTFDGSADKNITVSKRGCIVGQEGASTTNPYYKFASLSTAEKNFDATISFKVTWGFGDATTKVGILTAHARTSAGGDLVSSCELVWESAASGIDVSKFKIAYNATVKAQCTVELWAVVDAAYAQIHFDVIAEGTRVNRGASTSPWVLYNTVSAGSASAITSGLSSKDSTLATLKNPVSASQLTATTVTTNNLNVNSHTELFGSTPYIDFHYGNSTADYTSRLIEDASGQISINGVKCKSNNLTCAELTTTGNVRAANNGRVTSVQSTVPADTGMLWAW